MEDRDELLRLEYEYASRLLGTLTEYRFKLLALVPVQRRSLRARQQRGQRIYVEPNEATAGCERLDS